MKLFFALLLAQRQQIEEELGELDWQELPEGQDCHIIRYKDGNSKNRSGWPELHGWLKERSEKFYKVFSPLVKKLDIDI